MAKNSVNIKIEANTKEAATGINKISSQLESLSNTAKKSSFRKLTDSVTSLSGAFSFATNAMKAAKDAVMATVEAYQTQANAETQLETAIRNNPYLRDESVQKLKNYASELQSIGTVGDETLIPLMAQLVSAGRSESETMEIMSAALDASASGAISLESAVTSLSKSYSGEAGELSKLNPKVKELSKEQLKSGEAVKLIADSYKGMAQNTANATGGMQKLKNSWGDFLEVLGKPINAILNPIAIAFSSLFDKITSGFKKVQDKWDETKKILSEGKNLPTPDEINFRVNEEDISNAEKKVKELEEALSAIDTAKSTKELDDLTGALNKTGEGSRENARKILEGTRAFREMEESLEEAQDSKKKFEDLKGALEKGVSMENVLKAAKKSKKELYNLFTSKGLGMSSTVEDVKKILDNLEAEITTKTQNIEDEISKVVNGGVKGAAVSVVDSGEYSDLETEYMKATANLDALKKKKAEQDKEERDKRAAELAKAQEDELTKTQDFINKQLAIIDNGKKLQDEMVEKGFQESFDWNSYASSVLSAYQAVYTEMGTLAYSGSKEVAQQALEQLKEYYANALAEQANAIQKEAEEGDEQVKDALGDEIERIKEELDGLLGDDLFDRKTKINFLEGLKAQLEKMQEDINPASDAFKKLEDAIRGVDKAIDGLSTSWEKMTGMERFEALEEQGQKLASAISSAFSSAAEYMDNSLSAELSSLEIQFNKGLMSEEEYNEQKEKLEKDAARKKYRIQLAEWGMNLLATQSSQALAIAKALSSGTPPLNYIEAAVTGAAAAVQLAAQIAAKPIPPSYATGGVVGGFSGASVGGDDTYIHARSGEMMLNAAQQKNLFDFASSRGGEGGGLNVEIKNYKGNDTGVSAQMDNGTLKIIVDSIVKDSMGAGEYNSSLRSAQNTMQGVKYTS